MFHYQDARGSISICWEAGQVCSLFDRGAELTAECACPVFSFRLRNQDCGAVERHAGQGRLIALEEAENSARAEYAYDDLGGTIARIEVRFGEESWAAWRFSVENRTDAAVEWADYPQIALKKESAGRKATFYWPYNEGVQIDDIDLRQRSGWGSREPEFPGEGSFALFPGMVESQFVAYELDGGAMLSAQDERRGLKNIDCVPMQDAARLKMRIYAGGDFGRDWAADYDVALDLFSGGWMAAAEIYRKWNDAHLPEGLRRIGENDDLPEWYGDSPVVITYPVRGLHDMDEMSPNRLFPYENALPIIDRMAERLQCRILVLLMHWEGTAPWAPPFVWPPYGGEEMFKGFVNKLHARGHLAGVYLSGLGWTQQSNLIEEYHREVGECARSMCISPQGTLEYSRICTGQRRGYDFCPMGQDTAPIIAGEARSIASSGVDYAQIFDQNHGGNAYFCYSREHGHAPTPGAWATAAMEKLLDEVHAAAPGMLMGCESAAGEPYLKRLLLSDNRFNLGWFFGKPIPIFAYLYHEYLNNFMGNQVCAAGMFEACPESLAYRLAYSFAAGDLPTLVLTDDGRIMQAWGDRQFDILPDEDQALTLVGNLTALRRGAGKKFLHEGRMLPPLSVEGAGEHTFQMVSAIETLTVPRVLTSRWQAQDGEIGQALINWTKEDVVCRVENKEITVPAMDAVMI